MLGEDCAELREALGAGDDAAIARESADVLDVLFGAAYQRGIDGTRPSRKFAGPSWAKCVAGDAVRMASCLSRIGVIPPDMTNALKPRRDH